MRIADVGSGFEAGFYVLFAVYLVGMFALAVRGYMLTKNAGKHGGVEAEMQYHFLAGASFPAWILYLNFCASYIGGIVMVAT